MSLKFFNETIPDLLEPDEQYPYDLIYKIEKSDGTTGFVYYRTKEKLVNILMDIAYSGSGATLFPNATGMVMDTDIDCLMYIYAVGEEESWVSQSTKTSLSIIFGSIENDDGSTTTSTLVYTNYDILNATAVDSSNNVTAVGTEVFYKTSFIASKHIMPGLPDGCFDTYPYGCILYSNGIYCLITCAGQIGYAGIEAYGEEMLASLETGYAVLSFENGTTSWVLTNEDTTSIFYSNEIYSINTTCIWTNHDIANVIGQDENNVPIYNDYYALNSTLTFLDRYSASGTWFQEMARHVCRLSGCNKRYTVDSMNEQLEQVPAILPTNGKSWTVYKNRKILASDPFFVPTKYVNGRWYGSYDGNLAYSMDGFNVTQQCVNATNSINIIDYIDNLYILGSGLGDDDTAIYYSEDGINWTASNITGMVRDIKKGNNIWVCSIPNYGFYYSEDGKTWTLSNISGSIARSIEFANGIWVGGHYTSGLYYSEDGKTWNQSNITNGSVNGFVKYANGIWIAGVEDDGLYYSEDGKTWIKSDVNNITKFNKDAAVYANGIWLIAEAESDDQATPSTFYSKDGKTWYQNDSIAYLKGYAGITYDNNIWFIDSNSGLYYSEDGKTWNYIHNEPSMKPVYGNGIWFSCSVQSDFEYIRYMYSIAFYPPTIFDN